MTKIATVKKTSSLDPAIKILCNLQNGVLLREDALGTPGKEDYLQVGVIVNHLIDFLENSKGGSPAHLNGARQESKGAIKALLVNSTHPLVITINQFLEKKQFNTSDADSLADAICNACDSSVKKKSAPQ